MATQADTLKEKPDAAVEDAITAVQEASAASQSQSRVDLAQEDGSVLTITSFQGADAEVVVGNDGPPVALVPRLDDSPPPQGVGDDGVLRDDNGQPVEGGEA